MREPPIAGPMNLVPFMAVEFRAIAFPRSSGGTSFEYRDCLAGASKLKTTPETKQIKSMTPIFINPASVIAARMKLSDIMQSWVTISILRLLNLSATTPAKGVKISAGICDKNTESDKINTEFVTLYTSHPIATC